MLRVLLITREPWRDDSNEGSVLSSWFEDQPMELAHIYCKPGLPDSKCCKRFFQLTDQMAAKNLLKGQTMGMEIDLTNQGMDEAPAVSSEKEKKSFYDFFRRHNWACFFLAQEILWSLANWKSEALQNFVDGFQPDVIVAPMCYSRYVMAIQRWAAKRLQKPMAGIVWDDLYSLNQGHISPIFWLHRLLQRRSVKKTVKMCDRMYTLSPQQAEVYAKQFKRPFAVLPKVGEAPEETDQPDEDCVRFLYAGGIYYGRMETLRRIAQTLAKLNQEGYRCQLDVYTNSPDAEQLEASGACKVHAAVPVEQLRELYRSSHVALHVEGFERTYILQTQMSFSSKIVDCLSSGCAMLAVCPPSNCGYRYLQKCQAAVCVDQLSELPASVEMLVKDHQQREMWARRALDCLRANHSGERVKALIHQELTAVARNQSNHS